MVRSGQGRQRLKTLLPLDKARKEPLYPSAKIRSRWRSHQIFGATALRFLIVGTIRSLSSVANMILAWLQSELVRGLGSTASSSLPSLRLLRCLHCFSSSITGVILTRLVAFRVKFWRIYRFPVFFFFLLFFLLLYLASGIGLFKPLIVRCTTSLSNKRWLYLILRVLSFLP